MIGTVARDADYAAAEDNLEAAAVSSGGAITLDERVALFGLIADIKAANLWSKCDGIWFPVGSALLIALVMAKGSALTNSGFVAADWTVGSGLKLASAKYLDTGRTPAQAGMSSGSGHLAVYITTAGNGTYIGSAGASALSSISRSFGVVTGAASNETAGSNGFPTEKGHFLANAVGGNLNLYRFGRGLKAQDVATSGAIGTATIAIGALNAQGSGFGSQPANAVICGAHWGKALTKGECERMASIWLKWQKYLNRASFTDVGPAIAVYGDSTATGTGRLVPALQAALPNTQILDRGVSGQTASQIAARFIAGEDTGDCINLLWLGKNDFNNNVGAATTSAAVQNAVLNGIARCVAHQRMVAPSNDRYLILSALNARGTPADYSNGGNYPNYGAVETVCAATYGASKYADGLSRFENLRAWFNANAYDPGNSTDVTDHSLDTPPSSKMSDLIHENAAGADLLAGRIVSILTGYGWLS